MSPLRHDVRCALLRIALPSLLVVLLMVGGGLLPACGQPEGVVTVRIVGLKFVPASLTVDPGTKVRWVNDDQTAHTSTAKGWASNKDDPQSWNSFPLNPGDSFERSFDESGSFDYFCMVHPYMTGTVTVR